MNTMLRGRLARGLMLLACTLAWVGCATPPPQATVVRDELPFEQAIDQATTGLVAQTQRLPQLLARVESRLIKRPLMVDPMFDAVSGQQTNATQLLETRVAQHLARKSEALEMLPFQHSQLQNAVYVLTGTMTRQRPGDPRSPLQINLALTDLKSGQVVAQASALARDEGLDHTPLRYYQDSPVLVKDPIVDGYVRTTATPPGGQADRTYLERLGVATVIQQASALYNAERHPESLARYREASAMSGGDQLRTLNGIYLNHIKLGQTAEAERTFGQIVAYGLKLNRLDVKILFAPGSTQFWPDPKINSVYPMWLRQIAREIADAKVCMRIVVHTSRTGSEQTDDALSLQRAVSIQQRLAAEAPVLAQRSKADGVGWRENLIGSGSDNIVDALDRRVEFRVEGC